MDKNRQLIQLSEQGRFWSIKYEALTFAEQVFRAIWELEGEVNNGGFHQYYFNNSGDTALTVGDALMAIGADNTSRIVAEANGLFPDSSPPRDRNARQPLLAAFVPEQHATLERLSQEFILDPDNLTVLLHDYVKRNSTAIAGVTESFIAKRHAADVVDEEH